MLGMHLIHSSIFRGIINISLRSSVKLNSLLGNLTYAHSIRNNFATMGKLKIGTHDGFFQCDEALACYLLKTLPQYKDAVIVRTRNRDILDTCDIVVDVGDIYDPSKQRYDHHMRDFKESVSTIIKKPGYNWDMKLSSAGLIYCHFGFEIIKRLAPHLSDSDVETIFKYIYDTLMKEVDCIDNGISMCNEEPKYSIVTSLSARVHFLNPSWNNKGIDPNKQFLKAVDLTGEDFMQHLNHAVNVWLPAKGIINDAIARRYEVDPSGEIIEISEMVPWTNHLYTAEKELNIQPSLKYIIYFVGNVYRIRCVPIKADSFGLRLCLPEAWHGLRDRELDSVCGIEGSIFVHATGFCGGHTTREGVLMMARKSLELRKLTS